MTTRGAFRVRLLPTLLFFLLLLSPSASAHFHDKLVVRAMTVEVTQTGDGSAVVVARYVFENPGPGNYSGPLFFAFPEASTARAAGLAGAPLEEATSPFLSFSLSERNLTLAPGAQLAGNATYRVEVPEGERLLARIPTLYATDRLTVTARALEGYDATGVGVTLGTPRSVDAAESGGATPRTVAVGFDEPEPIPKLVWLVGAALLLVAAAAAWDLRKRRRRHE